MPKCQSNEIFTLDGKCQVCPPFSRPMEFGFSCGADECVGEEILQIDGTCKSDKCEKGSVKVGNECMICPDYTTSSEDQTRCEAP